MSEPTPDRPDDAPSEAPNDVPHDAPDPADLPPAYFLSLTLENVRCFGPEQTLDLSDGDGNWAQWTVILGDNGTGKTTLLQMCALVVTALAMSSDYRANYLQSLKIFQNRIKVLISGIRRPNLESFVSVNLSNKESNVKLGVASDFASEPTPYLSGTLNDYDKEPIPYLVGYGASRRMQSGGFDELDMSNNFVGLFDSGFSLPNAKDFLLRMDYAAKSGRDISKKHRDTISELLADPRSGILPDVDDIRISLPDGDFSVPDIEVHTPYGWVTMDQLSLGYRTMIAWIVDLARRLFERYPDMENPLEGAAVCLVDEIDLHLHPKWQRKIIGFLSERFPNTQFIVTAHSPLIVQAAQDANIAVLKRSDEPDETGAHYVEIHNDLEPLRNLRVDQILTSDLYGLDSARPPQIEHLVQEKIEILSKSTLSDEDRARLEELENEIGHLPAGETKEERETLDFMRRVAERLESEGEAVQANDA